MKNTSKQFVGLVTKYKNNLKDIQNQNPFLLARIKLTITYTIGIFIVVIFFSLAIYSSFSSNISKNLEYSNIRHGNIANIELQIIDRAQDQLKATIITIDLIIIILIGLISYYVAGRTLSPIKSAYNRQKKFVADTAHELRTPLAVMKTGAEATLNESNAKEQRIFIQDSLEEINHLSSMIDDLLLLAKGDDFKKPELDKVDLSEIANKVHSNMQEYSKNKKISLTKNIEESCIIDGNNAHLKRLLTNLVQNAINYNKLNGSVNISVKKYKNKVKLEVSDTGIGISKKDLSQIFNRFYKAEKSRSSSNGAGLGLSIVKEIVKMHNGKINITSELKKGTKITILF